MAYLVSALHRLSDEKAARVCKTLREAADVAREWRLAFAKTWSVTIESSVEEAGAPTLRHYREDYAIQIQAAGRSFEQGHYATAAAELRGAIMVLQTMMRREESLP